MTLTSNTASSVFIILSHFVDIRFKDNSNEVWGIKQVFELLTVIKEGRMGENGVLMSATFLVMLKCVQKPFESRQKEIGVINMSQCLLWILANLAAVHMPEAIPNFLILLTCLNFFPQKIS